MKPLGGNNSWICYLVWFSSKPLSRKSPHPTGSYEDRKSVTLKLPSKHWYSVNKLMPSIHLNWMTTPKREARFYPALLGFHFTFWMFYCIARSSFMLWNWEGIHAEIIGLGALQNSAIIRGNQNTFLMNYFIERWWKPVRSNMLVKSLGMWWRIEFKAYTILIETWARYWVSSMYTLMMSI